MAHTKIWQIAYQSRRTALLTAVGIVLVLVALSYASARLVNLQSEIEISRSKITGLGGEVKQLEARNAEALKRNAATQKELAVKVEEIASLKMLVLANLGHKQSAKVDSATLDKSLAARKLAERLASSERERRTGIKLRYHPSDFERHLNEHAVLSQLATYGFQVEKASSRVADIPLNTVWSGEKVHSDDVRLVVLTLMAAGVEIKAVRYFREPGGPKSHLVEIGVNSALVRAPGLSAEEVMALGSFKRQQ